MRCFACRHPNGGYASEDPKSVLYQGYVITAHEARLQRENLEACKDSRSLCEKHLANYEEVVKVLEAYIAKKVAA